jgi:ABC-2 type transport system ATP-binding protein
MIGTDDAVVVDGLEKAYDGKQVLCGVDLRVGRGEVFALLGPNGAGKTTTVEILEGYRDATAGQVHVLGFDPAEHCTALRQRTGVVLQACGFPNHLRVGELIDAWRSYFPAPRRADELLDLVELSSERRTLVRRLSGGQRRRLDFALALAGDPDLIFLDEPTTGFDPEARRRCWSAIENLRQLGKTILLTTHYLDEAERLADRIAILCGGRIRATGTAEELSRGAGTPTRITVRVPPSNPLDAATLAELGGQLDRDRLTILTDRPPEVLRQLLGTFDDLPGLVIEPPDLEATYLTLVGAAS